MSAFSVRGSHPPSIINFGDDLWEGLLNKSKEHARKCDLMLSLGE